MIRKATLSDLDDIIDFTRPYFDESIYSKNVTYSEDACRRRFGGWIVNAHTIVVEDDGIVGMVVVDFGHTFYEEKEADIDFFYVAKGYRGKGVSRLLAEAATEFAKLHNASIIYACSGSGMEGNNDKFWINLFKKFDYQVIGTTLARFL